MEAYTSLQRVLTALSYKEPDKVPLFLLFSLYGAKELNISIRDYFSNPDNIVEAQIKLLKKYRTDCLYSFFYASIEIEAFGGSSIFVDDGPPNAGLPIIESLSQIDKLQFLPPVKEIPCLQKVLRVQQMLKKEVGDTVPIIGVVMSPLSLPVMQMGFDRYLELMLFEREYFNKLMAVNEAFCIDWANAQIEAGATAICYFDPVASSTIIPPSLYHEIGMNVACRTLSKIKGPTATHLASGRSFGVIDDIASTGTAMLGVSSLEDIGIVKENCNKRMSVIGNLNGIEMCRWTTLKAEEEVKDIIRKAGKGGGLILSDNHGEIPWYVSENILLAIADAVDKWGAYPLKWL